MTNKKKFVTCLGITDKCYKTRRSKKHYAHVFFWEYDKKFNSNTAKFLQAISRIFGCQFHVLATKQGFHVISFRLFDPSHYLMLWSYFMQKYPDTDYRYDISHKILRLSSKGRSPKPEQLYSTGTNKSRTSSAHVSAYDKAGIIAKEHVSGIPIKTYAKLLFYQSRKRTK